MVDDDRCLNTLFRPRSQPAGGYHDQEILLALNRGDLAAADRLLAVHPEHADRGQRANDRLFLYVQGQRALAARDASSAIRIFQKAVAQRTPMYAVDWYEDCLANAYLRLGRLDEAILEYKRVLGIYPRLALAWHGLAKAYSANRQDALARWAYGEVPEIWSRGDEDIHQLSEAKTTVAPRQLAAPDR